MRTRWTDGERKRVRDRATREWKAMQTLSNWPNAVTTHYMGSLDGAEGALRGSAMFYEVLHVLSVGAIKKAPARRRRRRALSNYGTSQRWRPLQVNRRRLRCRGAIVNNWVGPGPTVRLPLRVCHDFWPTAVTMDHRGRGVCMKRGGERGWGRVAR